MRTCILHVGAPKTGSTTLQGFLGVYRDALAARGVDAPDFGMGDVVRGPIALTASLRREKDPAAPRGAAWAWLARRIEESDGDIVISREAFCEHFASRARLRFVRSFFESRGLQLKIVAYVRDHAAFINAAYTQAAKKLRVTEEFDPWLDQVLAELPSRLSYWKMFRNVFLEDGVEFVLRPLEATSGGGLVADFAGHLGCGDLDVSGFDASPYRNATPGPKTLAAGVFAARIVAAEGPGVELRPRLWKRLEAAAESRGWVEAPFFGPDAADVALIEAAFRKGDDALARRAWGGRWIDHVPPRRMVRNVFTLAEASPGERAEVEEVGREVALGAMRKASRLALPIRGAGKRG